MGEVERRRRRSPRRGIREDPSLTLTGKFHFLLCPTSLSEFFLFSIVFLSFLLPLLPPSFLKMRNELGASPLSLVPDFVAALIASVAAVGASTAAVDRALAVDFVRAPAATFAGTPALVLVAAANRVSDPAHPDLASLVGAHVGPFRELVSLPSSYMG